MEERIRQLIEYYGLNTRKFEEKISASNGQIYKYLSRGGGLNSETLAKILESFQQISPDWLILGKGEMLRKNVQESVTPQPADNAMYEKIIADLRSELAAAYRTIGQLEYRLQQEGEKTNSTSEKTDMAITLA